MKNWSIKRDPEMGDSLPDSVRYNYDVPESMVLSSLNESDYYSAKELKDFVECEFVWINVKDILVTNPLIFTAERNFMFIGWIVKLELSDIIPEPEEVEWFYDSFKPFIGKDYICFVCHTLEDRELEEVVGDDFPLFNLETLKYTVWPYEYHLPDTSV